LKIAQNAISSRSMPTWVLYETLYWLFIQILLAYQSWQGVLDLRKPSKIKRHINWQDWNNSK
jgi:hypothetical protein